MQYIAALDYEHLDNGVFLTSFARAVSRQKNVRPIIIHRDSAYTERIIQTGVMRDEATIRSIKDLNHRLVALLADQGVSAVGINGYQRKLITRNDDQLILDENYFNRLPRQSALLLSALVLDEQTQNPVPVKLTMFTQFLRSEVAAEELFIFSSSDADELFIKEEKPKEMRWNHLDDSYLETYIPKEFHNFNHPLRLTTARQFDNIPDLSKTSLIH